ncbi:hypothetical protein MMC17_008546 [Xylographa soralifera]|nr:hypothetical protein [Xylographa soralifera]
MKDIEDLEADWEPDLLRKAVNAASQNHTEEQDWLKAVTLGDADAWLALLLTNFSNTVELDLEVPYSALYLYKVMIRADRDEKLFDACPISGSLARVSIPRYDNQDDDLVMPVFSLPRSRPSLPQLRVFLCSLTLKDSQVIEIELTNADGSKGIKDMIGACANLKSLKYQPGGLYKFHMAMLQDPLARAKHSLERL